MTQKDFEESIDAVLVDHLEETLTPSELTRLKKDIVGRVKIDWDPFEDPDPLEVGEDTESERSHDYESFSAELDDEVRDADED